MDVPIDLKPSASRLFAGPMKVGCVHTDIGLFEANIDYLSLTEEALDFEISGKDDPTRGAFLMEGQARFVPSRGVYAVADVDLTYDMAMSDVLLTSLLIEARIVQSDSRAYCYLSIEWRDASGEWILHGLLPEVPGDTSLALIPPAISA